MRTARRKLPARLRTKTCLACGYDGPSLQGDRTGASCPCCGQDLASRPARSYAEMEGLEVRTRRRRARPRRPLRSGPFVRLLSRLGSLFTRR